MGTSRKASIKKSTIERAGIDERKLARQRQGRKALDHNAQSTKDSYQNAMLKLGMGTDNALSNSTYGFNPITRIRTLLEWIYRGSWLGAIAVDIVADDMTRAGIEINSEMGAPLQDKLRKAEIKYNFWGSVRETTKWSRLYGGAIMVPLIDGQDLATEYRDEIPLMPGQLKGFLVLDKWMVEARLEELVSEYGPDLGLPKFYRISSDAPALRGKNIHYSRVLRLAGMDLPYWQRVQENLWGLSVFERIYDRMVGIDSSTQGAAQLVYKAWLRIYKMEGLTDLLATGGDQGIATVMKKMEMMRRWQSNEGVTTIDAKDDITSVVNSSFTGISDVILQQVQQVSGTLQIPLVRMYGQSPAGLNSTGESDLRTYYDGINTKQESDYRRPLDRMYRMMAWSESIDLPSDFNWTFRPLWQLDEGQKSEIAARDATSVAEMVEAQLIDKPTGMKELKQQSRVTGRFDNITDEAIKTAEQEPPDGMGLPSMGLSDTEILAGGGDPTKHEHENPHNEDFPAKPKELEPPKPGKPKGMESKTGSVGNTAKPSRDQEFKNGKRRIKQNIYGNWVGYVGSTRVEEFGDNASSERVAKEWLAGAEREDMPSRDASRLELARKEYNRQSDLLTKAHAEERALIANKQKTKEMVNEVYDRVDKVKADFEKAREELDQAERASKSRDVGFKTHLQKSPGSPVPACGAASSASAVGASTFKGSSNTCSACERVYLQRRNEQRKAKGLSPVASWNDKAREVALDALPAYHVAGVQVSIENMTGSVRSGPGWRVEMPCDYGHIPCVDSAEGDMEWMDAFVGPSRESEDIWVVDAVDPRTGKFDEHKCMLGFDSEEDVRDMFSQAYHDDAARRVGAVTQMDKEEFQAWLRGGDHKRAVSKELR